MVKIIFLPSETLTSERSEICQVTICLCREQVQVRKRASLGVYGSARARWRSAEDYFIKAIIPSEASRSDTAQAGQALSWTFCYSSRRTFRDKGSILV
ncbi:hypothetical protein Q8A67_011675 [Cirrhinus molitorella]|uniref:Uncharacterized protein n=1 Tax=Cirrhinus molitorella TaxID=172907 RepID=A0AA88PSH6_9TELE|nr:hypothetical protein Q8A67_011675 [Cirrhinus molitorella]